MLDEQIVNYILLFIFLELYELQWQKAQTMMGMLARMYQHYKKSIFLFFIMHPTFYFAIAFMILNDYNIYALSLFTIKALDISAKIILIKQVFIDKELSHELSLALLVPLNKWLLYIGLIVYPPLIYFTLV
ncbi:MAG: hypothetical protein U9P38_03230 [Campylobacterota bacterium]|nr:hypothetical protein [Campylobacterota bacterium]